MPKFIPKSPHKVITTIRVNGETLKKIDAACISHKLSRNEFINQCIAFSLDHMSDRIQKNRPKTETGEKEPP